MEQLRRRHSLSASVLLALVSTLLTLAAGETALRIAHYPPPVRNLVQYSSGNILRSVPGLPYLYQPHADFFLQWPSNPDHYFREGSNALHFHTNNAGFRGRDFSLPRNGNLRIAFIGDSFCWGQGVKDEDTVTAQLEDLLRGSDLFGGRTEVYNFCLTSYNTVDEEKLLQSVVLPYRPDVCVVWFFLNDFAFAGDLARFGYLGGREIWPQWRQNYRMLDLFLTPVENRITEYELIENYRRIYREGSPEIQRGRESFRRLADLCRQNQILPVLAVHPILARLDDRYPFGFVHQIVLQAARENGLEAVDLFPYFQGHDAHALWVHPTDYHPNAAAQRMAAAGFLAELTRIMKQNQNALEDSRRDKRAEP